MYVPKKDSDEIVALGILTEDFNQGYAKIQIQKYFGILKLEGIMEIDPKICVPIADEIWKEFI